MTAADGELDAFLAAAQPYIPVGHVTALLRGLANAIRSGPPDLDRRAARRWAHDPADHLGFAVGVLTGAADHLQRNANAAITDPTPDPERGAP